MAACRGQVAPAAYDQPVTVRHIREAAMLRTVGARFARLLMLGGARLSVATAPPPQWPLDHTTDECLRCRDHLVIGEAELHGLLNRARVGTPVDALLVDVRAAERNVELVGFWEMLDAG